MANSVFSRLTTYLSRSGLLPTYFIRHRLAARYLHGSGLEIGALDHPLRVPMGVQVTYVDYLTKEENLRRYSELDQSRLVEPHLLEDGFSLSSVPAASQDFLIANHVLEHATNPIQALLNWERILKTGGIMFLSVPNGERCFDKDRPATTIEHLQADYDAVTSGDTALFARMNLEHYRQWLEYSIPTIHRSMGIALPALTDAEKESRAEAMYLDQEEIHYHVFSRNSLSDFLEYVTARYLAGMKVVQFASSITGAEFIVILQKQPVLADSAA